MISQFDCLFIGALALILLYLYLSWNFNFWKKQGISCDDKTFILFGSLKDAFLGKRQLGEILTELYHKNPGQKVVGWFKFRSPALLVRDPELIRKILINDFDSFRNNDVSINKDDDPIMGKNIFVLRDEEWKKARALVTPAFTPGKIKAIYPVMKEVATELTDYLKQHPEEIHVKAAMSRFTAEIVARCAFGVEGNNFKNLKPEMFELGRMIFEPTTVKSFKMMSFFLMPKIARLLQFKMVPDQVLNFFNYMLKDVIVHRQKNDIERNDLIQYLINVKKKSVEVAKENIQSDLITKVYTDEDVLSGCIMFFVEGYETTAMVINNILYQLALNQDVQDILRREVDETLSEGELTFEKLHAMKYLQSVLAEANRLLPVTFILQKLCTKKYNLDVGKEKPLVIEEGTTVIIPIYGIHNDPLYWEEPDKFKPERFSEKEEANAKNKGIFLPFSDGPRVCPGYRIATTIVKLAVVQIISQLEIHPVSKTPKKITPDPNFFMIAHKGGIYLRFVERSR